MREIVRAVPVPEHAETYAIHLVMGTQPGSGFAPGIVEENVLLGSSPRGAQALILAAKVRTLLDSRHAVSCDDIRAVAPDVLRHRIIINFQGQAEGFTPDDVVRDLVAKVAVPVGA